jgi:CIC family chloride channel protein
VLVGVLAGLAAVAFLKGLELVSAVVLVKLVGLHIPPAGDGEPRALVGTTRWWLLPVVTTLGGLLAGAIVQRWAPEAEGDGTEALARSFHVGGGAIRGRVPLVKGLASIVTIGTGGSAAQEGPTAQIGAGIGSVLARWMGLTTSERRLLMLAGAAGGLGAIFRAPLGGALYATEVLYSTTASESAALLPCLGSSIVAFSVFALFVTPRPVFILPDLRFHGLTELPVFAVLAVACAAAGWLFVRVFHGLSEEVFPRLPIPKLAKPALGGLLVGLMALAVPQVLASGYGWVQWGAIGEPAALVRAGERAFVPNMGAGLLLALVVLKILSTSLTIGSGGSGGLFGPSIFIGGMLGGAFGAAVSRLFPAWHFQPAAFVLVGMGGFFAGVAKTPLAAIVMICELSGSYSLLVPLMLVCGANLGLSRNWRLFRNQVPGPVDSPAHQGDFVVDVLEQLRVGDVPIRTTGLQLVPERLPFPEVVRRVADSVETLFPVVDESERLTGIFSLRDVRLALRGLDVGHLVLAADLATSPVRSVTPEDDLHTALRRLTELNTDELPVVRPEDPGRLVGLLARRDLVAAYSRRIQELRAREEAVASHDGPAASGAL